MISADSSDQIQRGSSWFSPTRKPDNQAREVQMPDPRQQGSSHKELIGSVNPPEGSLGTAHIGMVLFHQPSVGLSDHLLCCSGLQPEHLQSL